MHFNYNQVIRPRCELIKDRVKHFELHEVLPLTRIAAALLDRLRSTSGLSMTRV